MEKLAAGCLAWLALASSLAGADWPQFHGPNRDAASRETQLARSWPEGGPKVLWTVKVGKGYGGACIQGGKVYLLDRPDRRQDVLRCFDLQTGTEEWTYAYAAPGRVSHDGSRSTPLATDKYVVTVGVFGHVHCVSKATKKPVWTRHLLRDYGGRRPPRWGVAQSPLLYKGSVILSPESDSVGIVALAPDTGKELWRSKPLGQMHYVAPRVITLGGVDQVVTVNGDGVSAVDASNGKVLWNYGGFRCRISIPNVTPIDDERVFVTAGYDAGCAMVKVARSGESFAATELFKGNQCNSQMNPAILFKGHLYANSNSNSDSDGLLCMNLDGKVLWKTGRSPNFQRGHMLLADGMIYVIDGRGGSLHLVELSPKGFKELAKVEGLLGPPEPWAPLSLSDGKLIIRDQHKMHCLLVRGGKE